MKMRQRALIVILAASATLSCNKHKDEAPAKEPQAQPQKAAGLVYPKARRGDVVDDYHGDKVADPYRWLEDVDSTETRAWITAENQLSSSFLAKLPRRQSIAKRLTELWDYERFGVPYRKAGRYFFSRNSGLQNQSVLYWTDKLEGEPKMLLDPNTLSNDGTVALKDWFVSEDGKLLAYGLAEAGSDWTTWYVLEVDSGRVLPDVIRWTKFTSVAWTHDNKGFYYSRYSEPKAGAQLEEANYYNKLYYHRLGSEQAQDTLVYERPDEKEWGFDATVTDDGRYLLVTVWKGTDDKYLVLYRDLHKPDSKLQFIIKDFEAEYSYEGNHDTLFWFKTNYQAPKGKLVAIDLKHPAHERWHDVIPEAENTLEGVERVGDTFVANYLQDARAKLEVYDLKGKKLRDVDLPGLGTVDGVSGDHTSPEAFFGFESYTQPGTIVRYDVAKGESSVFKQPTLKIDLGQFETKQVFYTSKDGTRVPMLITSKKGLAQDGQNPTLLYGYGGFNISITPGFSPSWVVWMEMGGVFAVPNLRGGGEYGEAWHQAGTHEHKQNVFDDFIAAAEWLIANKYTSRAKLAIHGRSNGGLLIGAAITQRPDLFAAALPAVGVMDMLRFNKFTIGWAWVDDYGSPDNPSDYKALRAYSPLHNIKAGTPYPATLVTTADHDDRVVPAHSFKFTAALQAAQGGPAPILIRIDTRAGHGAGKPTTKKIEEIADQWAFLADRLKLDTPAELTTTAAP